MDMVKLMMKSSVAGGMPAGNGFSMSADSLRDIVRQVDFWTEEESDRLTNAVALDAQNKSLGPDWDVICKLAPVALSSLCMCVQSSKTFKSSQSSQSSHSFVLFL